MNLEKTITHNWEPFTNIQSKLSQSVVSGMNTLKQGTSLQMKIGTPLMYADSTRQTNTFNFSLVDPNNPEEKVTIPVETLLKASASNIEGKLISPSFVELPLVFTVNTKYNGNYVPLVHMNCAAISAIQPTYFGPYINGHACRCDLSITFQDIEPLLRSSFNRVTTSEAT